MNKPNLFTYATSELSQDAFLCWSLAWANEKESSPLKDFALDFLNQLLELHHKQVDVHQIQKIDIDDQHNNIDVLVQLTFPTYKLYIIIEGKTHSGPHSKQLQRYMKSVRSKSTEQDEVIGIYFKTGFIYHREMIRINSLETPDRYEIFDREKMIKLMEKHKTSISSDIFHDYYAHIKSLDDSYEQMKLILKNQNTTYDEIKKVLKEKKGQWLLMQKVFSKMAFQDSFYNGSNPDGSPWTQFRFIHQSMFPELPDNLFYRIDQRKGGYYLSIRQYLNYDHKNTLKSDLHKNKTKQEILNEKRERLHQLRNSFQTALDQIGAGKLTPGKVSNRGKKNQKSVCFLFVKTAT